MKIQIEYDGKWPCLCGGNLTVIIDEHRYEFGVGAIGSGGNCGFNGDWTDPFVNEGEWDWNYYRTIPERWNTDWDKDVLNEINSTITHGCCGGCL